MSMCVQLCVFSNQGVPDNCLYVPLGFAME